MKAFEKWANETYYQWDTLCPTDKMKAAWKGALQWVLSKEYMNPESPTTKNPNGYNIIDSIVIEEELNE